MQKSHLLSVFVVLLALGFCRDLAAQGSAVNNSIVQVQHDPPSMGRDMWFGILTGYQGATTNKFFALYITSPKSTTAWVQLGSGPKTSVQVQANKTTTFNMPLGWEMKASGIAEQKAVHVWSDDADLCCYVMSHGDFTSDGFYVYPSIGWGTEYVVAAYGALFATGNPDQPSEFAIIGNSDNTSVRITPSMDIRKEGAPGANCDQIFAKMGVPTTVTLNRGEVLQCKTTCTQDCDIDLTGTVITSTKPVGVVCGSQCPFIPCDFGYCDHICEMVPPTRTWATTYYTVPFWQPPGASKAHSASTFKVIGSSTNQKIYRVGIDGIPLLFCVINKFDSYERNNVGDASKWFSDQPFMLVQYINAASYPDKINGKGDPAEVAISGEEQFFKSSTFQLPVLLGSNGLTFTNYVNVIADAKDENVFLDTLNLFKSLTTADTRIQIDADHIGYRVPYLKIGSSHTVTSDSGAGVYIYGYGSNESYAYSGAMGTATLRSIDTLPIGATPTTNGSQEIVSLNDKNPAGGVYFVRADSLRNVAFIPDTNYLEGKELPNTYYQLSVIDPSQPASAVVSAFKITGARTTVTTTFEATAVGGRITPRTQSVSAKKDSVVYLYDTIINTGSLMLPVDGLALRHGDRGFTIDSAVTTTLDAGAQRIVRLAFHPTALSQTSDTLDLGTLTAFVNGSMIIPPPPAGVALNGESQPIISLQGRTLKVMTESASHLELISTAGATLRSMDLRPMDEVSVADLAAGPYMYRLHVGGAVLTGKISLP